MAALHQEDSQTDLVSQEPVLFTNPFRYPPIIVQNWDVCHLCFQHFRSDDILCRLLDNWQGKYKKTLYIPAGAVCHRDCAKKMHREYFSPDDENEKLENERLVVVFQCNIVHERGEICSNAYVSQTSLNDHYIAVRAMRRTMLLNATNETKQSILYMVAGTNTFSIPIHCRIGHCSPSTETSCEKLYSRLDKLIIHFRESKIECDEYWKEKEGKAVKKKEKQVYKPQKQQLSQTKFCSKYEQEKQSYFQCITCGHSTGAEHLVKDAKFRACCGPCAERCHTGHVLQPLNAGAVIVCECIAFPSMCNSIQADESSNHTNQEKEPPAKKAKLA